MKSDVFSYGVIVLEIVCGQRNREFSDPKHYLNLLGHVSLMIYLHSVNTYLNYFLLTCLFLTINILGMEIVD